MRVQKIACALFLALGLSGCASSSYDDDYTDYAPPARPVVTASAALPAMAGKSRVDTVPGQTALQCVPYAREHSVIKITGDAWTWWDKAAGKYERGQSPAIGAVMVLHNYAGPQHGHVAVVKRVVSPREIRIDHANWLNDGSIYVNNPVMDVSAANDWSQVRVYNIQTGGWGVKIYPVQGFIGSGSASVPDGRVAPRNGNPFNSVPGNERMPAPAAPKNLPRAGEEEDAAPPNELNPDTEALIAEILKQEPQPRMPAATPPARAIARPVAVRTAGVVPVLAGPADRNPPAGSAFALTEADLEIP